MENYGKLRTRYYVVKTSGIFSKASKIMEVYDEGLVFQSLDVSKASKGKDAEVFLFKEPLELTLSDRNDKDIQAKSGKQTFTLTCTERLRLMTDLLYFQDIWDIKNGSETKTGARSFDGLRQLDLGDLSSKIPVSVRLLRSALSVTYQAFSPDPKAPAKTKHYTMRYIDIDAFMIIPTGFLIDRKAEYEKLIFDNDSVDSIIEQVRTDPKKYLGITVPIKTEYSYLEKKVTDVEEYSVTARTKRADGVIKETIIHVDTNSIVEEDADNSNILRTQEVASLTFAKIKRKGNKPDLLKLYFAQGPTLRYRLRAHELDYLLANVLSSVLSKEDSEQQVPLMFRDDANTRLKVNGIPSDADTTYEASLNRALGDACGAKELASESFAGLLMEAALNLKPRDYDGKFVAVLFGVLGELAQSLRALESDALCLKEYATCLNAGETGSTKGQSLLNMYRRLPIFLYYLRAHICIRLGLTELATYQKQLEILMSLAGSKDPLVSFMASLCLKCFLRLNKASEKRLETPGKKWVVKECDVIKLIADLLGTFAEKSPADFFAKVFTNPGLSDCPYMQIYGLLGVFEAILMERREGGSHPEDVQYILDSIINSDKMLDIVEQCTTYNSKPIIYQASLVLAQSLLLIFNSCEKSVYASTQPKILTHSILLLWHIQLLLSSSSVRQKKVSAGVASLIIFGNLDCCALLARIFPRAMLRKVDADKRYTEWEPGHWKEFFALVQNNYNTTTEQWNEECREELIAKLRATSIGYLRAKYEVTAGAKWNYEEFDVTYACLESKCLAGRYYLSELVMYEESAIPYLKEQVVEPFVFWGKLITKLLGATEPEEQKLVLTTMALIYHDYFDDIRECEMLPYFVHLLEKNSEKHLHLAATKLILATVKAKTPELFKQNYKTILRIDGLTILLNTLTRAYAAAPDKSSPKDSEDSQIACNIIKIFGCMLKKKEKEQTFPEAAINGFCRKRECLSGIVQLLLVKSPALRRTVIKFVLRHFAAFDKLRETGAVELLILCVDESTGMEALQLLAEIQARNSASYNSVLDLSGFSELDRELIQQSPKVQGSIYLRYFPVCLTKYFADTENLKNALGIFLSNGVSWPYLIWQKDMRKLLRQRLKERVAGLRLGLHEYAMTQAYLQYKKIPVYSSHLETVMTYPQIDKEVRCGDYFLRPWNAANGPIDPSETDGFLGGLKQTFETKKGDLDDLEVVLKSFEIVFTRAGRKDKFPFFPQLSTVMKQIIGSEFDYKQRLHLKRILKFIFKITRIGDNFGEFEQAKALNAIILVVNHWFSTLQKESYRTLKFPDLEGLRWGMVVLCQIANKSEAFARENAATIRPLLTLLFEFATNYMYSCVYKTETSKKREGEKWGGKPQKDPSLRTMRYDKEKDKKYPDLTVADTIHSDSDLHVLSKLFQTVELALDFVATVSQARELHKSLLISGWGWIGLYHAFMSEEANFGYLKGFFDLAHLQILSLTILRNAVSFAAKEELQASVLFCKALRNLMGDFLVSKIVADLEAPEQVLALLNKDVEHPNLVWNQKTRTELRTILKRQLDLVLSSPQAAENFVRHFVDFGYVAYKDELMIDSVFVRGINRDPSIKLENPGRFFVSAVRSLASTSDLSRVAVIAEAIYNVVIYQKAIETVGVSQEMIQVLEKVMVGNQGSERIVDSVLGVFGEMAKSGNEKAAVLLMQDENFFDTLIHKLCAYNATGNTHATWAVDCVAALAKHKECEELVIKDGCAIVLMCIAFDFAADKKLRTSAVESLAALLSQEKFEERGKVFSYFVPRQLLEQIVTRGQKHAGEVLETVDADNFDAYLVWNAELRRKVREGLQAEKLRILEGAEKSPKILWADMEKDVCIDQEVNRNEILVSDVVLSSFVKCPMLRLKKPLNKFVESLSETVIIHFSLLNQHQGITESSAPMVVSQKEEQKKNDPRVQGQIFQNGLLCMVTGLLLSYEQLFRNAFNPNKHSAEALVSRQSVARPDAVAQISSESIKSIIALGLRSSNSTELNAMLLQLLFLIGEQKQVLEVDELQVVTVSVIQCLFEDSIGSEAVRKVQEILTLCVLTRIVDKVGVIKGKDTIIDIILTKDFLAKMKLMYSGKPYLTKYLELLLGQICQCPAYYKMLSSELKFELSPDCKMDKLAKQKHESLEKLWRKMPTKAEDTKLFGQLAYLEDCGAESFGTATLPLVSKKVFDQKEFQEVRELFMNLYGNEVKELKVRASAPVGYKKL